MIRLSAEWLFAFYLLLFLAPVFVVWIGWEMTGFLRERRALRQLTQCALCGHIYEASRSGDPSPCPRCGALNEHRTLNLL